MVECKVYLSGIHEVRDFCRIAGTLPYDVDLRSGKYYINAKSIMGIFSLDLSQNLTMVADTDEPEMLKTLFADFLRP